jgi:hypothetical protein
MGTQHEVIQSTLGRSGRDDNPCRDGLRWGKRAVEKEEAVVGRGSRERAKEWPSGRHSSFHIRDVT